jgi:hypothetical protein
MLAHLSPQVTLTALAHLSPQVTLAMLAHLGLLRGHLFEVLTGQYEFSPFIFHLSPFNSQFPPSLKLEFEPQMWCQESFQESGRHLR